MAKKMMKRASKTRSKASTKGSTKKVPSKAKKAKASPARRASKPAAQETGLQHLAVGFTANDAAESIKWYCDVLGFSLKERWEKDGIFLGGSVVQGRVTVNIGQDDWKLGRDRQKGQGVRIYITTANDIDAYAKAITSRGGTLDHDPRDDWGFRAFSLSDPDGYKITFMRPLK